MTKDISLIHTEHDGERLAFLADGATLDFAPTQNTDHTRVIMDHPDALTIVQIDEIRNIHSVVVTAEMLRLILQSCSKNFPKY